MKKEEELTLLQAELTALNKNLALVEKQLRDDKKMSNDRYKALLLTKAKISQDITDVELDIEELNEEEDNQE